MTMNETMMMVAFMLAPAFFSMLGLGAFGSPLIALLGEVAAKSKKRVFYDKYGQQVGRMGFLLLMLILVVDAAAIGVGYAKFPHLFQKFIRPDSPLLYAGIAMAAFIVIGIPYFLTWKKMRNSKGGHIAMGVLAATASLACVVLAIPAKLTLGIPADAIQALMDAKTISLPMTVMFAIGIMAAAAGLSCAYLVIRRNKDDFGRDYYNFSLKLAARWAALPMIGFLACQGWLFAVLPQNFKTMVMETPLGIVWAVGAGLGLICTIIWIVIARSETPLRLKGLTFVGVIILWLAYTMIATMFVNFMSMF